MFFNFLINFDEMIMSEVRTDYNPATDEERRLRGEILNAEFKAKKRRALIFKLMKRINELRRERDDYQMAAETEAKLYDQAKAEIERLKRDRAKVIKEVAAGRDELFDAAVDSYESEISELKGEVNELDTKNARMNRIYHNQRETMADMDDEIDGLKAEINQAVIGLRAYVFRHDWEGVELVADVLADLLTDDQPQRSASDPNASSS